MSENDQQISRLGVVRLQLHFRRVRGRTFSSPERSNFTFLKGQASHGLSLLSHLLECDSGLTDGYETIQSFCCAYTYVLIILYCPGSLGLLVVHSAVLLQTKGTHQAHTRAHTPPDHTTIWSCAACPHMSSLGWLP